MSLGARIVVAREKRGLDQKEVSDQIVGLSQQALSNLERRDSATSEYAIRIADVLKVSVRWLLDGTGDMEATDWPFPLVQRDRWDRLDAPDKAFVQRMVNAAIAECEQVAVAVNHESAARAHVVHEPQRPQHPGRAAAPNVTQLNPPHPDTTLVKTRAQKDRARQAAQRKRGRS